jgi:uncharacterized RDD family membrane protein YckC
MIDWVLCVLGARALTGPIRAGWPPVLMLIIEYSFFIGLFAQTPGMWVASIRCVPVSGRPAVGIVRAALRGVLLCLVIPALVMDEQRRGWHDRAAGTVVVSGRVATPGAGSSGRG